MRKRGISEKTQVQALFLDYDGTISPIGVPRSESRVSSENMAILNQIGCQIPVAVISTKDLAFVVKRTPFAYAWAGLGGLEIRIGKVVARKARISKLANYVAAALKYAKSLSGDGLTIEEKHGYKGATLAFSVDWRRSANKRGMEERALKILSQCERLPIVIIKYEGQPFFDVFPCSIDKGNALLKLKQKLGLNSGIMYMGDSKVDNSAFEAADISIGIIHKETSDDLACEYFVKFEDVPDFFRSLLKNRFRFNPKLSMVTNRNQVFQNYRRKKFA